MAENGEQGLEQTKQYIHEKMSGLLENIGDGYGEPLLEELIQRLEKTIAEFHQEVQDLLEELKTNSKKRREKMKQLLSSGVEGTPPVTDVEVPPEVSDFERRLESKVGKTSESETKQKEQSESDKKEPTKKRSLFGRKKKK
jgi:hypothetical protein